jgi:multiple sugar transport system permease protein
MVGWLFSAPGLVLLTAFVVAPFLLAVGLSFTNERLISPLPTRWVGLDNYTTILTDGTFWRAFGNNVWFVLVVVPVQTCLALWLAIMVNRRLPGRVLFRTVYFMPVVTVMAAAAVIWTLLYNPRGLVNAVMSTVTFGAFSPDWLNSTTWALPAIMIVSIWQGVGFQMVILLAALQDVPDQLYEAAALDGASRWQQFRNVTLPGLRPVLVFIITITILASANVFGQPYLITEGRPGFETRSAIMYIGQEGLREFRMGNAAAMSYLLAFSLIVVSLTLWTVSRKWRADR